MTTMAENAPMDYITYAAYTETATATPEAVVAYAEKVANLKDSLYNATPCATSGKDCLDQVMRLAYLNQQSDQGSLALRRGKPCLTQTELDAILNINERQNHPLNCAKINAKPYPYFDAGVMRVSVPGKFAYFSSRNNNFSNRDQTGIVCVKGKKVDGSMEHCELDKNIGVLQDENPLLGTVMQQRTSRADAVQSNCIDEASAGGGKANDQGATSCISANTGANSDMLSLETFTVEQAGNDALGDGDKKSCEEISWFSTARTSMTSYLALAIILAFVGFFSAWASVYCYNRIKARQEAMKETKFAGHTSWKKSTDNSAVI
jgi:hypothetical protein